MARDTDRWTSGADYDQWMGRWSRLVAREFLKWLDLPRGLRWIDICCGSGVVTEAIVELCQPASIDGIDASSEQINFARQHRPHPNVMFQTGNAMALPFADSSFEVAVCGLALNYIPEPVEGLKEFRRVVCPEGTIAAYVWDYSEGTRFLREFWDAAAAINNKAADFDQARRFPMCTPDGLRTLFEQAGLQNSTVHAIDVVTRFKNFVDYWQPLLTGQGSAPNYLATCDERTKTLIRDRLREALPANARGEIELPARAWAIRVRRP
jgi:SAM-dependent methyltransferase